jgi:hypothetical protein
MELLEVNSLYNLAYNDAIEEMSKQRKEIEFTNSHKNELSILRIISNAIAYAETSLTAYNYKANPLDGSASYNSHRVKEEIIKYYDNKKEDYKENSCYYFIKEYFSVITSNYSGLISTVQKESEDPFSLTKADIIKLIARKEAYKKLRNEFYEEWKRATTNNESEEILSDEVNVLDQIEWLGTQKELAELFIELKRKGYIKDIKATLVKSFFTNANSIQQILKPATDPKTKADTYSGVYTSNYKSRFDSIKSTTNTPEKK